MFKIKDKIIKNDIVVAPMAGISNDAFRELCIEFNAGLLYSEMISDKAIYYNNNKTKEMLKISDNIHPISLQLFGSELKTMVYAAKVIDKQTNADFIDINMGCPVNKVVKTGAGSAMMKNEDNTIKIIKEIIKNVSKPVTVKMRLGWDKNNINYLSLSKKLEDVGVSAIALHARTRSMMYMGRADWSYIKELKNILSIPVIGNGDVKSLNDFINMKKETNCDGVMIARGLIGNPFLIKEIDNYLNHKEEVEISYDDRFNYCLKHLDKLIKLKGEKIAISEMRGIAPHYITGLYNATIYKNKMNKINNYDDLKIILWEYKELLDNHESSSNNNSLNSFKG